jgi:hypothetical protein
MLRRRQALAAGTHRRTERGLARFRRRSKRHCDARISPIRDDLLDIVIERFDFRQ